jgi:hypothetical protein
MMKTLLVSVAGWVAGAAFGIFLLGVSNSFGPAYNHDTLYCALLGGVTVAIVAALASVGADVVIAIKQIKPFVLEEPAEPRHPVDAIRAGKPPN